MLDYIIMLQIKKKKKKAWMDGFSLKKIYDKSEKDYNDFSLEKHNYAFLRQKGRFKEKSS